MTRSALIVGPSRAALAVPFMTAAAPVGKTSGGESCRNELGWRRWTSVSSLVAYPSFLENGNSIVARIRRFHLMSSPTFGYGSSAFYADPFNRRLTMSAVDKT